MAEARVLEHAIPPHLQVERTIEAKMLADQGGLRSMESRQWLWRILGKSPSTPGAGLVPRSVSTYARSLRNRLLRHNQVPEGAAHMRVGVSGEMQQHVYWGSMRDRMAAAQTDHLIGERAFPQSSTERAEKIDTRAKRIQVPGRANLAMIRSGQDWSNTTPHERKLYLETMHPVLTKGMDFLRDEGEEVGCISNRFMDCMHKTSEGEITERTFGLAYFDDLKSLEGWSKQHKTHLDIFGRFLQNATELQNNVSLRLFHEVMVLKPEQQFFEYVGCHDTSKWHASFDVANPQNMWDLGPI